MTITDLDIVCAECGQSIEADAHSWHDTDCRLEADGSCRCNGGYVHPACCQTCKRKEAAQIELLREWRQAALPGDVWDYDAIAAGLDPENVPDPAIFDAFTAEIEKGWRCRSCGTDDPTTMDDGEDIVCYQCGDPR